MCQESDLLKDKENQQMQESERQENERLVRELEYAVGWLVGWLVG